MKLNTANFSMDGRDAVLLLQEPGEEARKITNLATCGAGQVYFWQTPSPMTLLHWLPRPLE